LDDLCIQGVYVSRRRAWNQAIMLPHLLVKDDGIGETLPDKLSEGGMRRIGGNPPWAITKDDDGKSSQNRSGLAKRSNPVALLPC
jgi:hypothetical protein